MVGIIQYVLLTGHPTVNRLQSAGSNRPIGQEFQSAPIGHITQSANRLEPKFHSIPKTCQSATSNRPNRPCWLQAPSTKIRSASRPNDIAAKTQSAQSAQSAEFQSAQSAQSAQPRPIAKSQSAQSAQPARTSRLTVG